MQTAGFLMTDFFGCRPPHELMLEVPRCQGVTTGVISRCTPKHFKLTRKGRGATVENFVQASTFSTNTTLVALEIPSFSSNNLE